MSEPKAKPKSPANAQPTAANGQAVIQTKVTPYPIEASILRPNNPVALKGSIVKLTEFGFLMRVAADHFYSVGETQQVEFVIPASQHKLTSNTLVMKTYDAMAFSVSEKLKMVELHFINLALEHSKAIRKYLVNSGQAKPE